MMRLESSLFLVCCLIPALAWAQSASPSSPSSEAAADVSTADLPDEAEMERYRAAVQVIGSSRDIKTVLRSLSVLRDRYPRSREILVETAMKGRRWSRAFALQILGENDVSPADLKAILKAILEGTYHDDSSHATGENGGEGTDDSKTLSDW